MNLDFLKSVEVKAAEKKARTSNGPTLVKKPVEGASLRLFRNGRIYPSDAFREKHALDFFPLEEFIQPGTDTTKTMVRGNGLDFFTSDDWTAIEVPQTVMFCGITPRQGNLKIDIFNSTSYDRESGTPERTVYDLGKSTFGEQVLVPKLAEMFDICWDENRYVDIIVREDITIQSPNDVYNLPKVVQRGENKGQSTYVRRESISVFPVELAEGFVTNKMVEENPQDYAKDIEVEATEVPTQEHEAAPTSQTTETTTEETTVNNETKAADLLKSFN